MTAGIWWVPEGSSTARELLLPDEWTSYEGAELVEDVGVAEAIGGRRAHTRFSSRYAITLIYEELSAVKHPTIVRELVAIQEHLQRGGWVAVAVDASKAWAGLTTAALAAGDASVTVENYPDIAAYSYGWGAPSALDEVWIGRPSPDRLAELLPLQIVGPLVLGERLLVFDASAIYGYDTAALIRESGTWPRMVLSTPAAPILARSDLRTVDVRLDLIESYDVAAP